ncbi:MAG: MaoC family dehydratase N-terminal domain-containing protein [Actinomycetota bacterium]|nr:MaoC family dehydratase N-terminal domain-containing protein [Actinomycetota bacterium]
MALNAGRVGHHYPVYRYEVCREKVREYAQATGVRDPVYRADAAEVAPAEVVAPPTFAACFTLTPAGVALMGDPDLGAHPALVHSRQEYQFHRQVRVGDVLECRPWITDIAARGRLELLTLQVDCRDADTREPVVTSRGTLIFFAQDS